MGDSGNQAIRILVVDQDLEMGGRISHMLLTEGYRCEATTSAARGLVSARSQMPSLMIIDTDLDACSGFAFAQNVREEYPQHDIPVIFVSQSHQQAIVNEARAAGGTYFLSKPIDLSVLLELVDKSLWMPHLVRRHIDNQAHPAIPKPPRVLTESGSSRRVQL